MERQPRRLNTVVVAMFAAMLILQLGSRVVGGCFLRNCPIGGKRSLDDWMSSLFKGSSEDSMNVELATAYGTSLKRPLASTPSRQCPPCGPNQAGVCIGPSTCCLDGCGCVNDTVSCKRESSVPTLCLLPSHWKPCGDAGVCVAHDVCCSPDKQCEFHKDCSAPELIDTR